MSNDNIAPVEMALYLADARHWHVFPLAPGSKQPFKGSHGLLEATLDPSQIECWWQHEPRSNIGVATGPSGLAVLDVDPKNGGEASFEALRSELGPNAFETMRQFTPSGGMHFLFAGSIASGADVFGDGMPGLDTRGLGGYVVVAPSIVDGRPYVWEEGYGPQRPLLPWPEALRERARLHTNGSVLDIADEEIIPEHRRNDALTRYAGRLRRLGTGAAAIEDALYALNERQCRPPLPRDEVHRIALSVGRYAPSERLCDGEDRHSEWTLESAASITARGVQPVEYDVEGLLTRDDGPGIMFGPPGALKSFLAAHLAGCIATGEKFLGHFIVRRRPFVIFVNFDAGANAFARRIPRLGFPVENFLVTSPENYDAAALREICKRYPEAFVVLDTFSDMYRSKAGEDPAQAMRRFVRELRSLFAEFSCNGLILDHPRRPRDGETNADYYGSTQKEATARIMWHVTRLPTTEQGIARAKITCRKMSEAEPFSPFVAKIDFRGELVVATYDGELDQSSTVAAGPSDVEIIEQLLRSVPDSMTSQALQARSGRSRDRVLDAVKESKKILALGKGRATRYKILESSVLPYDLADDLESSPGKSPGSSATLRGPYDTDDSNGSFVGAESSAPPGDPPDDFTEIEI